MKTYSKFQKNRIAVKTFTAISKKQNCNIRINALLKENALTSIQKYDSEITYVTRCKITENSQSVDEFVMINKDEFVIKMKNDEN